LIVTTPPRGFEWALAFSFARAIQQPALEIWHGEQTNVSTAQQSLHYRAQCNRAARRGEYNAALDTNGREYARSRIVSETYFEKK
jgi:fructose-bisphosphate aldolase class I